VNDHFEKPKDAADDKGPIWQLSEMVKHHQSCARAYRADAERYLRMATEADQMAQKYESALVRLRS
jgi:hypothetical protein